MKLNVGNIESFIRIFIGTFLLYAGLHAYVPTWAGFLGGFILLTGLARFSPLKAIFGINGNSGETSTHH
jgi:NADH:ubiquinone oxidoreductase subunit 4 (subunit M)